MKTLKVQRAVKAAGNIDGLRALVQAAEGDIDTVWDLCREIFRFAVNE
jgi:hypothetical protein